MDQRLPPLPALRAFEATARHLSFTRAAEELAMTQAAVSYQIKVLEDRIGEPLLLRSTRSVALTDTGAILAASATDAFRILAEGYERAKSGGQVTLSINAIPSFIGGWLAVNIGSFQVTHPKIAVRIETEMRLVDLVQENYDIGIRIGRGNWRGLTAHMLLRADFTPMLSPALAASIGGVHGPADLLKLPIIDASDMWWPLWFRAAGVDPGDGLKQRATSRLGSQSFEGRAAIAGMGVAILTRSLFKSELASGALIAPFDIIADDEQPFWLVYPEGRGNVPKIRAFRDWILTAIAAEASG